MTLLRLMINARKFPAGNPPTRQSFYFQFTSTAILWIVRELYGVFYICHHLRHLYDENMYIPVKTVLL